MPRAIVVEDDPDVLDIAATAIRSLGYEVETYADPRAALLGVMGLAGDSSPRDLLVTDLHLPGALGSGLMTLLRAGLRQPMLPTVIASGVYGRDDEAVKDAIGGGAVFVQKPYRRADLARAIYDAGSWCGAAVSDGVLAAVGRQSVIRDQCWTCSLSSTCAAPYRLAHLEDRPAWRSALELHSA